MTDVRKDDRNIPSYVEHLSGLSDMSWRTDSCAEPYNDKSISLDYFDSETSHDHSTSKQPIHDGQNDNSVTSDNSELRDFNLPSYRFSMVGCLARLTQSCQSLLAYCKTIIQTEYMLTVWFVIVTWTGHNNLSSHGKRFYFICF